MTRLILLLAAGAVMCGLAATEPVYADSIISVEVQPVGELSSVDEVSLEILIGTTSTPALLFSPTETLVSGNEISINLFATKGALLVPDTLIEHLVLGVLEPRTYLFGIQLHFAPLGLVVDEFVGSFTVVPEPNPFSLLAASMVGLLLLGRPRRTL